MSRSPLRLKWLNQAQFAGFYVAKEKGYYKAEGLDVNIQPGGPDFPAVQMVTGGNEQFGVTGADQILIARSKGVPVVALAVDLPAQSLCAVFAGEVRHQDAGRLRRQESRREDRRQRGADLSRRAGQGRDRQIQADRNPGQIRYHAAADRHRRCLARLSDQRSAGGEGKGLRRQHRLSVRLRHRSLCRHAVHHGKDAQGEAGAGQKIRRGDAERLERRDRGARGGGEDHRQIRRQADLRPRTGDDEGERAVAQARQQTRRLDGRSRLELGAKAFARRRIPESSRSTSPRPSRRKSMP